MTRVPSELLSTSTVASLIASPSVTHGFPERPGYDPSSATSTNATRIHLVPEGSRLRSVGGLAGLGLPSLAREGRRAGMIAASDNARHLPFVCQRRWADNKRIRPSAYRDRVIMAQQRQDYFDALDWVTHLATEVPTQEMGAATPCEDFDVRSLLGHLIGTAHRGLATARGISTRDIPHVVNDVPDAELASTYARLAASIRAVWTPLTAADQVNAPWGPCTAMDAARGFTVETITHGWDLAVATGQPSDAPNSIADRCLVYAAALIPDRLRGVMYDRPIVNGKASSATEQLAQLLGHQRTNS